MRRLLVASLAVTLTLPMAFVASDAPATPQAWGFDAATLAGDIPEPMLAAYL